MSFFDAALTLTQESTLILPSFDSTIAFDFGTTLRTHIQTKFPDSPAVVIQITAGTSENLYFFATAGKGTNGDNRSWVDRKRRSVARWERSTGGLNAKFKGILPAWAGTETEYAIHGGGFPLRVEGVEPLVGIVVVSGLKQTDDHLVIVEALQKFIPTLKQ
ncbi:hypothetical protein BDY24DRAFT_390618 [Mrakia frigida]|uniref:uncharacterized protein n=1 Tax=Mrakia frigida TaxID=29902 RepID=UPI003FCC10E4